LVFLANRVIPQFMLQGGDFTVSAALGVLQGLMVQRSRGHFNLSNHNMLLRDQALAIIQLHTFASQAGNG
jgi:cyclophilin family peptidyl-prolyl cis-trans isomerase